MYVGHSVVVGHMPFTLKTLLVGSDFANVVGVSDDSNKQSSRAAYSRS